MNGRFTSSSSFISASGTKTLGHSLKQSNTHDQFWKLIYFPGKSHKMENSAPLARGWIDYPPVNKTSLYMEKMFSAFNYSTDPLVN